MSNQSRCIQVQLCVEQRALLGVCLAHGEGVLPVAQTSPNDVLTSSRDVLNLDKQLCFALYSATHAMMSTYRELLAHLGLTFPQYLVMLVLWEKEGTMIKDLGQELHLDSGTLSPLLKRLEGVGWITRTRRASDERSVEIRLTEAGERLKEQASSVATNFVCRTCLDTEAFAQLHQQLYHLASVLTTVGETKG